MNVDDFITSNKPKSKKSVFDEHIEDINKLLKLNYSQKQVIEFLKSKCKNKTGLSEQNLSIYLRKSKNLIKENTNKKPVNLKKVDNIEIVKEKDKQETSFHDDALEFVKNLRNLQ